MAVDVMERVWRESRASGSELLVLLALADWAGPLGVCCVSKESLSEKVRLESRQLERQLARLVRGGDLVVRRGGGKGRYSRYWVRTGLPKEAAPPWEMLSGETGLREAGGVLEDGVSRAKGVVGDLLPRGDGVVVDEVSRRNDVAAGGVSPGKYVVDGVVSRQNPVFGDGMAEAERSYENPGIRYPENLDSRVVALDAQLRGLRGYQPEELFFRKVAERYCDGSLDLEEQGIRIRGWFARHPRRLCTPGFVLTWLHLERYPEKRRGSAWKGGAKGGERCGVGRDGGLEALGRG